MTSKHPVTQQVIATAIKQLADDCKFVERLAWWAQHAHASERWIQFELAFLIDRALSPKYAAGCERGYVDIVIYDGADAVGTLWLQAPHSGVELKWYANWWFKDRGAGLLADVAKTVDLDRPTLALGIWLFAIPKSGSPRYRWILEQAARIGVATPDDVRAILARSDYGSPHIETPATKCAEHSEFKSMTLWSAGYFNNIARSA